MSGWSGEEAYEVGFLWEGAVVAEHRCRAVLRNFSGVGEVYSL